MRKITLLSVVAMLVLASLSCIIRRKKPACEADNLLLTVSSFPGDLWEEIGSREARDVPSPLGIDRAGTSFSTQRHGIALQKYFRFSSETDSVENYLSLKESWFNLAPEGSIRIIPEDLSELKLGADEYCVGCTQGVIETCRFVGLYRTYVVEFKLDMPSATYSDFIRLLEEIDQKMLMCIED